MMEKEIKSEPHESISVQESLRLKSERIIFGLWEELSVFQKMNIIERGLFEKKEEKK